MSRITSLSAHGGAGLTEATKQGVEAKFPIKDQAWLPVVTLAWGVTIAELAATD
jgi:hypothetical protein